MKTTQVIYNSPVTHLPYLSEFVEWVTNKLEDVPEQDRDNAVIDFNIGQIPHEDYPYVFVTIEYERDETEDEETLRLKTQILEDKLIEQNEREMLKELKEKYE